MSTHKIYFMQKLYEAKLKKMFVWHCLPRVSLGGSVAGHFFFLRFT